MKTERIELERPQFEIDRSDARIELDRQRVELDRQRVEFDRPRVEIDRSDARIELDRPRVEIDHPETHIQTSSSRRIEVTTTSTSSSSDEHGRSPGDTAREKFFSGGFYNPPCKYNLSYNHLWLTVPSLIGQLPFTLESIHIRDFLYIFFFFCNFVFGS